MTLFGKICKSKAIQSDKDKLDKAKAVMKEFIKTSIPSCAAYSLEGLHYFCDKEYMRQIMSECAQPLLDIYASNECCTHTLYNEEGPGNGMIWHATLWLVNDGHHDATQIVDEIFKHALESLR